MKIAYCFLVIQYRGKGSAGYTHDPTATWRQDPMDNQHSLAIRQ